MPSLLLFESAMGYALFDLKKAEEIASSIESVQRSVKDFKSFSELVSLRSFIPFKDPEHSLDNLNKCSEGVLHEFLASFLENNVSKKDRLGVIDSKLGGSIQEELDIKCFTDNSLVEITRGIREHFAKFMKNLDKGDVEKAQLGLGHAYSRAKVKFNVNKADNMITQSIALLDQLDKDINTFAMRMREWYAWHFPEMSQLVKDNLMYAKLILAIKKKENLNQDSVDALTEVTQDKDLSKEIIEAARSSMGVDLSEFDMSNIEDFAERVVKLTEYRDHLYSYLESKMRAIAPNLTVLVGEKVGARLIAHAGSLVNLAKCPASTIQILGAEKALFRALKTRGKTPKYGLIYHSSFIGKASAKNKGRISRYLANKCAIASRIDSFLEFPTSKYGESMKKQVEERLAYYEGQAKDILLKKNVEIMREVAKQVAQEKKEAGIEDEVEEAPKKSKKRKAEKSEEEPAKKKKKKDKKKKVEEEEEPKEEAKEEPKEEEEEEKTEKKKKKKEKKEDKMEVEEKTEETPKKEKKKDKKKKKKKEKEEKEDKMEVEEAEETPKKEKKEKKKKDKKKKKKKKSE